MKENYYIYHPMGCLRIAYYREIKIPKTRNPSKRLRIIYLHGEVANTWAYLNNGLNIDGDQDNDNIADWVGEIASSDWAWFNRGYTGHACAERSRSKMLPEFGLINMPVQSGVEVNGRAYDPVLGRMLQVDNYIQNPYSSRSYNRYSYVLNNPLKYVDPDGEFVLAAMGVSALVGYISGRKAGLRGMDLFGYTFASAIIGGASAGIGVGISSSVSLSLSSSIGGFASGFISGAAGGTTGGFVAGLYGTALNNSTFNASNNILQGGLKGALYGGFVGGVAGGISNGVQVRKDGLRFWDGAKVERGIAVTSNQGIPLTPQVGDQNCGPACLEAIDRSLGGDLTQSEIRDFVASGTNPNTDGINGSHLEIYTEAYLGTSVDYSTTDIASTIIENMNNRSRVILIKGSGSLNHAVVVNQVTKTTITKLNGTIVNRFFYQVMNPASASAYQSLSGRALNRLVNIAFYIHP